MPETSSRQRRSSTKVTPIFEDQDPPGDFPKTAIAEAPQRTQRAKEYEQKVDGLLGQIMQACVASERTVADGAAILAYGGAVSSKAGDLADHDPKVRRAIDIITAGSENPYLALGLATLPLAMQIVRNHETEEMGKTVGVKIPFTKRTFKWKIKFRIRNPFLRSMSKDPEAFTRSVFSDPDVAAALASQNIEVALPR